MITTDLRIGDLVQYRFRSSREERLSIPMRVVGIFSSIKGASPEDTVYLDFEGNEGDLWEQEVQNLVFAKKIEV